MKKKVFFKIMTIACAALLCSGCGNAEETSKTEEDFSVVKQMRMQVKEEGIFYIDGYTEMMRFYDFSLGESLPLCDRPNCEHNSAQCNAYFSQGYMSGMGCYRDKIYFYDNMDPEIPFYQCDKNGNNRKVLAKLNKEDNFQNLSVSLPMFFEGNEAYFGLTDFHLLTEPVTRSDGTIADREQFFLIGKINLESGDFEILKEPEEYSDTEWVDVLDYADGNVIYSKRSAGSWEEHIFHVETKTDEILFKTEENPVHYLGSIRGTGQCFYEKDDKELFTVYSLDMKTKEEKVMIQKEIPKGKEIYSSMTGEKLFYCIYEQGTGTSMGEEFGVYDLITKEEKSLTAEEYKYAPIAECGSWYVSFTEDGTVCIPKEAYEKKDWSQIKKMSSF